MDEVYGEGNAYDFGARIYDPRIGKFLTTDPLADYLPDLSPYSFADNTPISSIDENGLYPTSPKPGGPKRYRVRAITKSFYLRRFYKDMSAGSGAPADILTTVGNITANGMTINAFVVSTSNDINNIVLDASITLMRIGRAGQHNLQIVNLTALLLLRCPQTYIHTI